MTERRGRVRQAARGRLRREKLTLVGLPRDNRSHNRWLLMQVTGIWRESDPLLYDTTRALPAETGMLMTRSD